LNTGNTPAHTVTTEAEPDAADELADCPQCESPNLAHARFCSSCGTKLIAVCGECGTESAAEARFCLHCGARFGEARPARAQLERYIPKELLDKLDPPVHRAIWWANDVWSPCYFAT
jgi:NADH pyrophosphatase NudC (nudix superfamily)